MRSRRYDQEIFPVLLAVTAAIIWLVAMWFYLLRKSSFFDDTFIYLHIANNIIELGLARYFPMTGSDALLASSPLRLITIVPAALIARLASDPERSFAAATLTMYLSGLFASFIYLPFYRSNIRRWLIGLVGAGLIAVCTETGLQMEGILLFWAVFTIFHIQREERRDRGHFYRLGMVAGLLCLTRPEYGAVAFTVLFVYTLTRRNRTLVFAFLYPLAVCALTWIAMATWLGVYPIPTSFITKALTLKSAIFSGGSLGSWLPIRLRTIFELGELPWIMITIYFGAVMFALATVSAVHRLAVAGLLAVLVLLWSGPGLYVWYFENLAVVLLAICCTALMHGIPDLRQSMRSGQRRLLTVRMLLVLTPVLLFVVEGFLRDRHMFWDLRADRSRGTAYVAIGKASVGNGRFRFDDRTGYLMMSEIGIAAYFAGNTTWLYDRGGLAQPGEIVNIENHPLAVFYPRDIFRNPIAEFMMMYEAYERPQTGDEVALFFARGNPAEEDVPVMCDKYYPATGVCLKYLQSLVRVDSTDAVIPDAIIPDPRD